MSLKKEIILTMAATTGKPGDGEAEVQLLTPAGVISGKAAFIADDVEGEQTGDTVEDFGKALKRLARNYKAEKGGISESDGYIVLKDATLLTTGNGTFAFGALTVFFDQVIAITIGKFN